MVNLFFINVGITEIILKRIPREKDINKIKAVGPWNCQGPKYMVMDVLFCIEKIRAIIAHNLPPNFKRCFHLYILEF
ncbi:MAG: hypothetical protein NZ841_03015 [Dictyoglomus sp.]|nr:hypothetical protein [Dictyoglomus sp.]MDW8188249.1 hypothetical protein [Dictyoglomus sp.]